MLGCARAGGLGLGPTFLSRWRVCSSSLLTVAPVLSVLFKLHCITTPAVSSQQQGNVLGQAGSCGADTADTGAT